MSEAEIANKTQNEHTGKKVLFTHEMRSIYHDGKYYGTGYIDYNNMLNYLYEAESGVLMCRFLGKVDQLPDHAVRLDGDLIEVEPAPCFDSPVSLLKKFPKVFAAVKRGVKKTDYRLARMPGTMGLAAAICWWLMRKPYGVEFVGHATESIVEMLKKKGKRPGLAVKMIEFANKFFVRRAAAVAYVSDSLRRDYPHRDPSCEFVFSDVILDDDVVTAPRNEDDFTGEAFRLVYIGRISAEKGCEVLLEAFSEACRHVKANMVLRMVGDGPVIDDFKAKAEKLGVLDRIEFTGRVNRGPKLFELLNDTQLFVLPSFTEGMPRSLLEAMARGVPALCSSCGGIPELLSAEDMARPRDVAGLAEKMVEIVDDPKRLAAMSHRNFETAKKYWPENLAVLKDKFWDKIKAHKN